MNRRFFLKTLTGAIATGALSVFGLEHLLARQSDNKPFDVYLTFDDGPFAHKDLKTGPTDIVLQTLQDKGVLATFFLHGIHITDWDGPVLARYINLGHAVGNHLWRQG